MGTRNGKLNEIYMADQIPSYINPSLIQRFVYKEIIVWTVHGVRDMPQRGVSIAGSIRNDY